MNRHYGVAATSVLIIEEAATLTLVKLPPKNVPMTLSEGSGCLEDTVTTRVDTLPALRGTVPGSVRTREQQ